LLSYSFRHRSWMHFLRVCRLRCISGVTTCLSVFFLQQAISWELAHSILLRIASCSFCCSLLTQLAWRHTIWLRLLFQYSRMSWRRYDNTLFNCLVIWSVRSSYISLDVALGYLRNLLSQHSLSKSSTSCTTGDPCPRVGVSSSSDESGAARMTIRICK